MEEKKEIFDSAEETFQLLVDLRENLQRPALGPSLFNIFETVSKFNEENKNFITTLYKPHEFIYADVISSFENPDCQCRKRFTDFIENNIEISKNVFFSLLAFLSQKDGQNILDRLKSFYKHYKALSEEQNAKPNEEQSVNSDTVAKNEAVVTNGGGATSYIGKSFIIEKTQEEYAAFFETLLKNKVQYNGLSVIPYNLNQMMVLFY